MNKTVYYQILAALVLLGALFSISANAQNLFFQTLDGNVTGIEEQALITGASLAADFDGEGLNNDVALIDQGRGLVIVLLYDQKYVSPKQVSTINIGNMFARGYRPTSATAFTDAVTGLQNIAITVAAPLTNLASGKLIIGKNDGSGLFGHLNSFTSYDISAGPTNINHGDYNNDGFEDLSFIDFRNNTANIVLYNPIGRFEQPRTFLTGGIEPVSATIGDFNDDDNLDLIVLNKSGDNLASNASSVTTLLGSGDGNLSLLNSAISVAGGGISIIGGRLDITGFPAAISGKAVGRIIDFNDDGFPDVAVLSTGNKSSARANPTITVLFNNPTRPGRLELSEISSTELIDPLSRRPLILAAKQGGTELVSGLGFGTSPVGIGGAYHALAATDFNADGNIDLVVAGAIANTDNTTARAVVYLLSSNEVGSVRLDQLRSVYRKATAADTSEASDTFVAAITGAFAQSENEVPGVLQISLSGNLWIDSNKAGPFFCGRAPFLSINRSDLNAPFPGGGRKVIITAGQTAQIPVSGIDLLGGKLPFRLAPTRYGQEPPSFVTIKDNGDNTALVIVNSADINRGPGDLIFPISVETRSSQNPPPGFGCGRLPLTVHEHFTLVVRPNNPPVIETVPDQTIATDSIINIQLTISDAENQRIMTEVSCDRGTFASIDGAKLTIAPQTADIGISNCTIIAKDEFGLAGSANFTITVKPAPVIDAVSDQFVEIGASLALPVRATDPVAAGNLKLSLISALTFVTLTDGGDGTGMIVIAPMAGNSRGGDVIIQATAADGRSAQKLFKINVKPRISNVLFKKNRLFVTGDFGSLPIVTINSTDVSDAIIDQTNSSITLKGNKKRLQLVNGVNQIKVTVDGISSDTFMFNTK